MPCYHPLKAYQADGQKKILFKVPESGNYNPLQLPCGQCIGCRLERSRQWAIRCVHEASLYEENCFITLTYSPDHIPLDGSLNKTHFQNFMKYLRRDHGSKIRFFQCGEYGDQLSRPHYHACLFNFDFPDKEILSTRDGIILYTSKILADLWGKGFCTIGQVTHESAAYVARYVMKKITGKQKDHLNEAGLKHYETIDHHGEIQNKTPEYITMSRRPGLARGWYDQYSDDVYPSDQIITQTGSISKPPRYYDNLLERTTDQREENEISSSPRMTLTIIKGLRKQHALLKQEDNTPERLKVREICKQQQINHLPRAIHET